MSRLADGEWRPGWTWLAVLAAATAAEAMPVRIEGVGPGTTSLATVFIAATATRLGPEASASVGALAIFLAHLRREYSPIRKIYNVWLYCAAGAAAGLASLLVPESWRYGWESASAFYVTDVGLLTLVVAVSTGQRWLATARMLFRTTLLPFVAMGSLTVVLAALWKQGWVVVSLGPPLILLVALQRRDAAAREKQRELDRAKDEFLATTSHELRTPLASVYGAAQTLEARPELEGATQRKLMTVLARESARLTDLVEDVLWAARLGAGQVDRRARACSPGDAIDEVLAAMAAAGHADRLQRGPVTDAQCRADPDHLRRILLNLVDNALNYSPAAVEVAALGGHRRPVRFLVDDEGEGIQPEDRGRIFERFVRLDPGMEKNTGGTGLGLYICRALAENMGGRLWVETSPHGGARFSLELPASDGAR